MSCLYFVRDCGTLCTFSLVQGRVSTRGALATCLSNVLLGLKYLCRSYVQTDRTWCGSRHTRALLVLWMQRVWCVLSSGQVQHESFSYSGSVTACKITIGKSLQVMHGDINPINYPLSAACVQSQVWYGAAVEPWVRLLWKQLYCNKELKKEKDQNLGRWEGRLQNMIIQKDNRLVNTSCSEHVEPVSALQTLTQPPTETCLLDKRTPQLWECGWCG